MDVLLDTVTLSEIRKRQRAYPAVQQWQASQIGRPGFLSVITLHEIRFGIHQVQGRDAVFAELLSKWYAGLIALPEVFPVLPVDRSIAEVAAEFRAIHRLSINDSLIAATARVHGLTLATRNATDFADTGIELVNPWEK